MQVAVIIAEYPYFAITEAPAPITVSVIIPPIMPPGPNKANVAVIAAAPAKPVVLIIIRNTRAGTPFKYIKQKINNNNNILFFSGCNAWNIEGITFFIDKVIPLIKNQFNLLIGGKICEILKKKTLASNIILCGVYDNPNTFYQQGDIVINPVFNGSGLKIKTFEALAYGKITVVHKHSSIGIYKKESSPLFIVDNEEDFAKILDKILSYCVDRKLYQEQAKRYIDDYNFHIIMQYKKILGTE